MNLWGYSTPCFHPHLHILVTDGVFLPVASGERATPEDNFYGYLEWDSPQLTCLLRQSVISSFKALEILSPKAAETMLSWPVERTGFNVHVDTRIEPAERGRLKTVLRYLTRPPSH